MKKILSTLILTFITALVFAQSPLLRPRIEITECTAEETNTEMEIFYMNDENPRVYYLSLGGLGVGTDIIQIDFDPVFEVFIPLGNTLDEAIAKMEEMKALYSMPRRNSVEMTGVFAALYPNDNVVNFTVTSRRLLASKILEFSLPTGTDGIVRATHIYKANFGTLLTGLKLYKKLHPKE